eukprot:m.80804 g.80804  ORF g.80804 m.80804 type:complete len:400 (+) comp8209_c0_seq5:346-1545(+)
MSVCVCDLHVCVCVNVVFFFSVMACSAHALAGRSPATRREKAAPKVPLRVALARLQQPLAEKRHPRQHHHHPPRTQRRAAAAAAARARTVQCPNVTIPTPIQRACSFVRALTARAQHIPAAWAFPPISSAPCAPAAIGSAPSAKSALCALKRVTRASLFSATTATAPSTLTVAPRASRGSHAGTGPAHPRPSHASHPPRSRDEAKPPTSRPRAGAHSVHRQWRASASASRGRPPPQATLTRAQRAQIRKNQHPACCVRGSNLPSRASRPRHHHHQSDPTAKRESAIAPTKSRLPCRLRWPSQHLEPAASNLQLLQRRRPLRPLSRPQRTPSSFAKHSLTPKRSCRSSCARQLVVALGTLSLVTSFCRDGTARPIRRSTLRSRSCTYASFVSATCTAKNS